MSTSTTLSEEYITAYQGDKLIAVAAVSIPIVLICVSLRFYARRLTKAPWGLDDGLVLLSLIVQIGESVLAICFVKYAGVGRHFSALEITEPKVITRYWKTLLVVSVYYCIVVPLPKLAILAMYWRLLNHQKLYRIAIYIIAGIIITNSIVCTIMSLNLCRPFEFNWDKTIPGGTCLNVTLFEQMASLPNIITDIPMLVIPIPIVWKLNATKRVKFFLALTLLTGSVGLATSIVRFASFSQESAVDDGTWSSVDLMTWTIVEPDFYLIAACLPTYRPILVHILRESSSEPGLSYEYASNSRPSHAVNRLGSSTFQRMESDQDMLGGTMNEDIIRLVNVEARGVEDQNSLKSNEIHVQRSYDVKFMPKAKQTWG